MVVKEVKLIAQKKGIRIHQNLDNLATFHQTCLHHIQTLVDVCHDLVWIVNMEKSELKPKQIFLFVGYQFNLNEGKVRLTLDRWQTFNLKI